MFRLNVVIPLASAALAVLCSTGVYGQEDLSARDVFWSATDLVGKRPSSTTHATKAVVRRTPVNPKLSPEDVPVTDRKDIPPPSAGQPSVIGVNSISSESPLGLRYSVLKQASDGTYQEVPPDATFHAGDRIRLSVMSNQEGYLYIIQQGSSGAWRPLYPPAGSADKTMLKPGQPYNIPGGTGEAFQFNGTPGQERIFMLLSRSPEMNLDQTISSLRQNRDSNILASNAINNDLIENLRRDVRSRDLVFTKFQDEKTADSKFEAAEDDKATYVVNKTSSKAPDAHIVVDVVLAHQ